MVCDYDSVLDVISVLAILAFLISLRNAAVTQNIPKEPHVLINEFYRLSVNSGDHDGRLCMQYRLGGV